MISRQVRRLPFIYSPSCREFLQSQRLQILVIVLHCMHPRCMKYTFVDLLSSKHGIYKELKHIQPMWHYMHVLALSPILQVFLQLVSWTKAHHSCNADKRWCLHWILSVAVMLTKDGAFIHQVLDVVHIYIKLLHCFYFFADRVLQPRKPRISSRRSHWIWH